MTIPQVGSRISAWPGLDAEFHDRASSETSNPVGRAFCETLTDELESIRGKECLMGPPLLIRSSSADRLRRFAAAYHDVVQTIVATYRKNDHLRRFLALPTELVDDRVIEHPTLNPRIHLCRIDLMLERDGGFKVLETNANCPGALLSMGIACRAWREFLTPLYVSPPDPLDHEWDNWMANWFIQTAIVETGEEPSYVPLLRQDGGNRLELPGLRQQLIDEGVAAIEIDPRAAQFRRGNLAINGRTVRHAYMKLGVREFQTMSQDLAPLRRALLGGNLFIPNGILGRFVGDNKLCLAIMSDPAFSDLVNSPSMDLVRPHIPWSRAIAHCDTTLLRHVCSHRGDFVLKRPLDTKGRGVIVGQETDRETWKLAVSTAIRENWLVQEFCSTTQLESDFPETRVDHHDLSLGVTNGDLAGVISRSSSELRLNVARSGRLHPVFVESSTHVRW